MRKVGQIFYTHFSAYTGKWYTLRRNKSPPTKNVQWPWCMNMNTLYNWESESVYNQPNTSLSKCVCTPQIVPKPLVRYHIRCDAVRLRMFRLRIYCGLDMRNIQYKWKSSPFHIKEVSLLLPFLSCFFIRPSDLKHEQCHSAYLHFGQRWDLICYGAKELLRSFLSLMPFMCHERHHRHPRHRFTSSGVAQWDMKEICIPAIHRCRYLCLGRLLRFWCNSHVSCFILKILVLHIFSSFTIPLFVLPLFEIISCLILVSCYLPHSSMGSVCLFGHFWCLHFFQILETP